MLLRPLADDDRSAYSHMLHRAFNTWYGARGWPSDYFGCSPEQAGISLDVYGDISPGCSVAAFDPNNGEIMGACFYHPREHHVSFGVMSVSPDHFRRGVGRAPLNHIVDFTDPTSIPRCAWWAAPSTWIRFPSATAPGSCRAKRGNAPVPGQGQVPAVQRGEPAEFPAGNRLSRQSIEILPSSTSGRGGGQFPLQVKGNCRAARKI